MPAAMPAATPEDSPGSSRRKRLAAARLYLVLPSLAPGEWAAQSAEHGARLERLARGAIEGGVEVVQLREKHATDTQLLSLAARLARLCTEHRALFIVNDSPRLALDANADGVHVGQDDMPVEDTRAIVGEDMLVGLSTHARAEIDAAPPRDPGGAPAVDYIAVGPVHETPTKPGRPAVGTELVSYAAERARVPFFAIGGLHAGNLEEVFAAGATRAVILRAIADAQDPREAARAIRAAIEHGPREGAR